MSEPEIPRVEREVHMTPMRREVLVIYLSVVSGLEKKDIEDMLTEAYPRQCENSFRHFERKGEKPTHDGLSFRVDRDVWRQVMKSVALARGKPSEHFPFPFAVDDYAWKEGLPVSREYLAYCAQKKEQEKQNSRDSQASTVAKGDGEEQAARAQDDLRVVYKHKPRDIKKNLIRVWPTIFYWEQVKDGQPVVIRLHELAAVIVFLRRMYDYWDGKDLSGGMPTRLTSLAWKENPLSEETKPEEIRDLLNELGLSMSEEGNPTFEDILQHDTMGNFWGTASMLMFCSKSQREKPNGETSFIRSTFSKDHWKKGMIEVDSHTSVEKAANEHIGRVLKPKDGSTIRALCNFPPFIRVKYQANKGNSETPQRFSDLRRFRLRGTTLIDEKDTAQQEHDYVLIACFLKPNDDNKVGEVRLYSESGGCLVPLNKPSGLGLNYIYSTVSTRRIGDLDLDCILLYGKAKRPQDNEDEVCSEIAPHRIRTSVDQASFAIDYWRMISALPITEEPRVGFAKERFGYDSPPHSPSQKQTQANPALPSARRPGPSTQRELPDASLLESNTQEGPSTGQGGGNKRPYSGDDGQPSSRPRLHGPVREPSN